MPKLCWQFRSDLLPKLLNRTGDAGPVLKSTTYDTAALQSPSPKPYDLAPVNVAQIWGENAMTCQGGEVLQSFQMYESITATRTPMKNWG